MRKSNEFEEGRRRRQNEARRRGRKGVMKRRQRPCQGGDKFSRLTEREKKEALRKIS